jgi:hypothetical protein
MKMSENISELALALATAQGVLRTAKRTSENPYYHSKYADLAEVWDACREPLVANDLAVTQMPSISDRGEMVLVTMLMHKSGQWISGEQLVSPAKPNDPQALGSALTYFRRYGLSSVLGISFEGEDNDAETAQLRPVDDEPRREVYQPRDINPDMMCPIHELEWRPAGSERKLMHIIEGESMASGKAKNSWCLRDVVLLSQRLQSASEELEWTRDSTAEFLKEQSGGKSWTAMTDTQKLSAVESIEQLVVSGEELPITLEMPLS